MEISKSNEKEKNSSSRVIQNNISSTTKGTGGWTTLPFIIGSMMGLSLAAGSWYTNLTLLLTRQYNMSNNVATLIYNVINIGVYFFSIFGAILSDTLVGSSFIINTASFASLLGLIMLGLSTIIPSLRPNSCNITTTPIINTICDQTPTTYQYAFLFVALLLASIGYGCTRFMLCALGAHQFDEALHRRIFFNVFVLAYEVCWGISYAITSFVELERVGWKLNFAIGNGGNAIAIVFLLVGSQFLRHVKPRSNPSIGKVYTLILGSIRRLLAAFKGRNSRIYEDQQPHNGLVHHATTLPSNDIRFSSEQGRAKSEYDAQHDNYLTMSSKSQSHNQNEIIEDLWKLPKILPVWSAGIILNTIVSTSINLLVLQATTINFTIGHRHIKLPTTSTITIVTSVFTATTVSIFDIFLYPMWQKVIGRPMKPLQRGGIGHVFVVFGMVGLAIFEIDHQNSIKSQPLNGQSQTFDRDSATWLLFSLALLGIGAGYYFPGGLTFNYQEFPNCLKSVSTTLPSLQSGIGFYLGKVFINVVKSETTWLPNNGTNNFGRLDRAYWTLGLILAINFGYYLICSTFYKYNNYPASSSTKHTPQIKVDEV